MQPYQDHAHKGEKNREEALGMLFLEAGSDELPQQQPPVHRNLEAPFVSRAGCSQLLACLL